ncbi:O-antigen ligase family protein [Planctomycetota bacterium]
MVILFLVSAIIAIVWGVAFLRYGGVLSVALLTLAVGTCFGAEFFQFSLLTLDRLLVGVLIVAYVLLRRSDLFERKPLCTWDAIFVAYLAWLAISTFTHDWRAENLKAASRVVFYYLFPAAMYWIGREASTNSRMLRSLYIAATIFGLYLAVTSIAEWQQIYAAVFPRYIINSASTEFLGRGRGPLLNPSGNGILLCLGLGCLFMLWPRLGKVGRVGLVFAFGVFGLGVLGTLTRCVWLGAAMGIGTVILMAFPRRLKFGVIISGTLIVTILVGANWQNLKQFKRDKNVSAADMAQSASIRPVLAYIAWEMFKDHPIKGVGFGQYKQHDKNYFSRGRTNMNLEIGRPYHQHNVFLSTLTETGIIGMNLQILVLLIWCRAAYGLYRQESAPLESRQVGLLFLVLMCAYFANGMFQDVTIIPMVHMTLFFFAGLVIGQYLKHHPSAKTLNQTSRSVIRTQCQNATVAQNS